MKVKIMKNANSINRNSVGIELEKISTQNVFSGLCRRVVCMFALFVIVASMGVMTPVEVKADCPENEPGANPWEPYNIDPNYSTLTLDNGCVVEFQICRRLLPASQQPPTFPQRYEYYIYAEPPQDCDMEDAEFIFNYKTILEQYLASMHGFARFLYISGNIIVTGCGIEYPYDANIIIVGQPSCITNVYTHSYWHDSVVNVTYSDGTGYSYIIRVLKSKKTVKSCRSFDPYSICFSTYEYCWINGDIVLLKREDMTNYIDCPPSITVMIDPTMTPPYNVMDVTCHPVCGQAINYSPELGVEQSQVTGISVTPNPTNNGTTLTFTLLTSGNLTITLVNVEGQELLEIHNAETKAGDFTTTFSMSKFPTGVYFLKINHNGNVKMEKVIRN